MNFVNLMRAEFMKDRGENSHIHKNKYYELHEFCARRIHKRQWTKFINS